MAKDHLIAEFPELARLSKDEFAMYLAAFGRRRAAAGCASAIGVLVLGAMVLVVSLAALVVFATVTYDMVDPKNDAVSGSMIALSIIGVPGLSLWWTWLIVRRYLKHMEIGLWTAHLRGTTTCAGCGYDCAGVNPIDGRPGVIRCPECALVNPVPLNVDAQREGSQPS